MAVRRSCCIGCGVRVCVVFLRATLPRCGLYDVANIVYVFDVNPQAGTCTPGKELSTERGPDVERGLVYNIVA